IGPNRLAYRRSITILLLSPVSGLPGRRGGGSPALCIVRRRPLCLLGRIASARGGGTERREERRASAANRRPSAAPFHSDGERDTMLRAAVIGVKGIGRTHLAVYRSLGQEADTLCRLQAVCDVCPY